MKKICLLVLLTVSALTICAQKKFVLTSVGRRLNWCGRQYHIMRYGECYVALRSQRTNHVLHYEYTSTGENLPFLEEEYEIATENGVFQMNGRWSDNPIVL